jgi:alginate O-acetyltransferase complex protein AlgI
MSYTIDIYRRKSEAHRDFVAFFTYVSFFPQLIAGPIIRYSDLLPQLESNSRLGKIDLSYIQQGIYFFVIGLSKKILIADRIGATIDPILGNMGSATGLEAWLCMFGYAFQLYFDFSGYSDMAVGLGKFFHLDFPKNFNSPYKSFSITEFWRRWHISLSSWLRDYLYISLGGNRHGVSKTYRNLLITMLLGGLWHGAGWTFVIWGGLHGTALAFEKYITKNSYFKNFPKILKAVFCFAFVCFAWVFFRAVDLGHAFSWLSTMFDFGKENFISTPNIPGRFEAHFYLAMLAAIIAAFFKKNTFERVKNILPKDAVLLAIYFVLCLMFLRSESAFLYFQF